MSEMDEALRRIVREELKLMLESIAENADRLDTYGTGELLAAGLDAVKQAVKGAIDDLHHTADCTIRYSRYRDCSCGVEED